MNHEVRIYQEGESDLIGYHEVWLKPGESVTITAREAGKGFSIERPEPILDCGRFTYNTHTRTAHYPDGGKKRLSKKQHAMAMPMLSHPNTVLSYETLLASGWPEVDDWRKERHYVRLYIGYLIERLGPYFPNVREKGYAYYDETKPGQEEIAYFIKN